MGILPHDLETIKPTIADDAAAWRAWVADLPPDVRRLLFVVQDDDRVFRCPTNGRLYIDPLPRQMGSCVWTSCRWCDAGGRVRGQVGYDAASPQPHCYEIEGIGDALQIPPDAACSASGLASPAPSGADLAAAAGLARRAPDAA